MKFENVYLLKLNGYGYGYGDSNGYGDGSYYIKKWGEWYEVGGELENSLCNNIHPGHYQYIDSSFIKKITNVECLRILRDKIGLGKYLELLQAKVINEEVDHQGNNMRLFKCDENGETSLLLEVVCPSTMRVFHLYPPNQKSKTCFEAKTSSFEDKPVFVRHGDVALVKIGEKYLVPFSET